ncbi:hypothetical protein C2W59_00403 [Bacillus pumilus]|nr:hypothetical protein C2W59_00403 [Bacillus pumilus]
MTWIDAVQVIIPFIIFLKRLELWYFSQFCLFFLLYFPHLIRSTYS